MPLQHFQRSLSSGISAKLFDSDFLEVDGLTQLDYTNSNVDADDHEGNLNLRANVTLTANISEHVRAVLGLELRQRLMDQGVEADSIDFDIEEFIKSSTLKSETLLVNRLPFSLVSIRWPLVKTSLEWP